MKQNYFFCMRIIFIPAVPKKIYFTFVGDHSWRLDILIIIQYPDVLGLESRGQLLCRLVVSAVDAQGFYFVCGSCGICSLGTDGCVVLQNNIHIVVQR